MQHAQRRHPWLFGRRLRIVASTSGSVLVTALWSAPVLAQPEPAPAQPQPEMQTETRTETTVERETTVTTPEPTYTPPPPTYTAPPPPPSSDVSPPMGPRGRYVYDEEDRFDSGFHVYIAPGALNVPYGGRDSVDYGDSFDPGYQWGFGFGYFARTSSPFALHIGAFFEQAMINSEFRQIEDDDGESIFRAGLELEPGIVIGERVHIGIPLRGGYAADVFEVNDELHAEHGPMFGVGLGFDVAIWRGFYIGTALATDLQFFRSGDDYDAYLFSWRTRLGVRF